MIPASLHGVSKQCTLHYIMICHEAAQSASSNGMTWLHQLASQCRHTSLPQGPTALRYESACSKTLITQETTNMHTPEASEGVVLGQRKHKYQEHIPARR